MEIRYSWHPEDVKHYTTEQLREHFLIQDLFVPGKLRTVYSHVDRIMVLGACPSGNAIKLEAGKEMGVEYFLERRELGIINVGGAGVVTLNGEKYELNPRDGLYVGMGVKEVSLESKDAANPAKFYMNSAPAHKTYPTVKVDITTANKMPLGTPEASNVRTIYQFIHPAVMETCQLLMGLTMLEPNNMWNTMPSHTHERRMEVYFYFDLPEDTAVFHMMGQPNETRHIVMKNEEAVISPSWSIHSGVGTHNYSFIWGMVGENQEFTDMDTINMKDMK